MPGDDDRFMYTPVPDQEFLFCMMCLTGVEERYKNYKVQKSKIPNLVLFDAITPDMQGFDVECSKHNFHKKWAMGSGSKALWLSQISVFNYFLKTRCNYLVLLEDDAVVPPDLEDTLVKKYINHNEFITLGGTRLGQYASCNLYNKHCVKNILNTIKKYPIDRNLDHYVSNINPSGLKQQVPYNVHGCLTNLPKTITTVNIDISRNSARELYNKTEDNR